MRRKKNNLTLATSAVSILLVAAIGFIAVRFAGNGPNVAEKWAEYAVTIDSACIDGPIALGGETSQTDSQQEKDGTVRYRMNQTPFFAKGDKQGTVYFESDENNIYFLKIRYVLEDDAKTVVYQTDAIPPGSHIGMDKLETPLEKGEYPAICKIELIEMDTLESAGFLEEEIKIVIEH